MAVHMQSTCVPPLSSAWRPNSQPPCHAGLWLKSRQTPEPTESMPSAQVRDTRSGLARSSRQAYCGIEITETSCRPRHHRSRRLSVETSICWTCPACGDCIPMSARDHVDSFRIFQRRVFQSQCPIRLLSAIALRFAVFDLVSVLDRAEVLPHVDHHQHEQHAECDCEQLHLSTLRRIRDLHDP